MSTMLGNLHVSDMQARHFLEVKHCKTNLKKTATVTGLIHPDTAFSIQRRPMRMRQVTQKLVQIDNHRNKQKDIKSALDGRDTKSPSELTTQK